MATTDLQYIVRPMQTPLDICIESGGEIDGLFTCAMNNGIGITDDINPGDSIIGIQVATNKVSVVALFTKIPPASGITVEQALPGGIGYMQIQQNFKTS